MTVQHRSFKSDTAVAILVGTLITALWILSAWRYGFDLADEGYYWYGAQRMVLGDMPMRDFMAYDIGRYAWTAGVMKLLGDSGIVGARIGAALYQVLAVVVGTLLALRAAEGKLPTPGKALYACVVAMLLNVWVHPYYKVFDYGTSIVIVAMLVLMLSSQSAKSWFGAGIILGLSAIIGRNHGIYGAISALLLLCFLMLKQPAPGGLKRPAFAFFLGTIVGFSPTFALCALVDGFATGFIASIIDLLSSGATNIALPVPWPWKVGKTESGWLLWAMGAGKGLGFIAIMVLPILAIISMARRPLARFSPAHVLMLCSSVAGLAYAHYAFSRADLTHLALAMPPLLLLIVSAAATVSSATLILVAVLGGSVLTLASENAFLAELMLRRRLVTISINGSDLYVVPSLALQLREVEQVFDALPQARNNFLAIPNGPGLYAVYKKKMPIWEIYSLSRRNAAFEAPELARLKAAAPEVVLLSDHALDDRPELRYSNMHPVLHQWIAENYHTMPGTLAPTSFQVLAKNRESASTITGH